MNRLRVLRILIVALSSVAIAMPAAAFDAPTPMPGEVSQAAPVLGRRLAADVELDGGGWMSGRVLRADGLPLADVPVVLRRLGHEVACTRTDAAGRFRLGPLCGGTCELFAQEHGLLIRAWAAGTAPPSGNRVALIVIGDDAVRGQMPLKDFLASDAVIICALVAALIAVPIAVACRDSEPRSP